MHIYIPTRGRASDLVIKIPPAWQSRAFFVVDSYEYDEYMKNNPDKNIIVSEGANGITQKRQWILDNSETDYVCQVDDDVNIAARIDNSTSLRKATDEDLTNMYNHIEYMLKEKHFAMVGVGPRFMQQAKPKYSYWQKISTMWAVNKFILNKEGIALNPDIAVMEDFILNLQLLTRGYPNILLHDWCHSDKINKPGGCSIFRNITNQQESAEYLQSLFPKYVTVKGRYNDLSMKSSNWRISWSKIKKDFDIYGY